MVKITPDTTITTDTPEHAVSAIARTRSEYDVTSMPWLPQLPEQWAIDLYDRIEDAERKFASPTRLEADYYGGVATEPDQLAVVQSSEATGALFTAEHATKPISVVTGAIRFPDAGTGGLSAVLAEEHGTAIIPVGLQTTNVPSVDTHPLKDKMKELLPTADLFVSVHGMARGKFMHPLDRTEIQASLGLGIEPTEELYEFGRQIVRLAREDLGLYVVIGNDDDYFVQKEGSADVKLTSDGKPYRNRLAALKPKMTTNVARQELAMLGSSIPALQIELTKFLRLSALDTETRDKTSQIIGVALGYKLLERIVELNYTSTEEQE